VTLSVHELNDNMMVPRSRSKPEVVIVADRNKISVDFQRQHMFSGSQAVIHVF